MSYIFKQHYTMPPGAMTTPRVLVVEGDDELRSLYAYHLAQAGLAVTPVSDQSIMAEHVAAVQPHILVCNPEHFLNSVQVAQIRSHQPSLLVVTVGDAVSDAVMSQLLAHGVSCHINRAVSRPRDIVVAIEQLITTYNF